MSIKDKVSLSESVQVTDSPAPTLDAFIGQAVKVCVVCGAVLCKPYPAGETPPKVSACHEERFVREDYAPSVKLDPDKLKAGKMVAVAGEPMDHVRARAAGK